ncbi:hypothetical protein C8J57DRAFT_1730925 [Mycena rebaudengoi]|nr:hypothetical protein C8J57DRAFT_1732865 [Mycena rebaudengoi]KAJ7226608.1 hypothetical protein C8J57DRAFT_1730925 [Mycena rebaudengoi]
MPLTASRDARPQKRRRLADNTSLQPIITVTEPMASPTKQSKNMAAICTSCQRAITALAGVLLCARCASPTCAICSRTCTASMPSPPPTPHLTWSPTPTPSPSLSPRRTVLALNSANTNSVLAAAHTAPTAAKRKKHKDDEEAAPDDEADYGCGSGCGRSVCRECCFENLQESTTTCYDCHGR